MTSPSEVALRLKMMVAQNKQRQGQQLYDTFDQSGPLRSGMQQGFEKKKQQELLAQQGYQQERREQLKATIQQETQRRNQEAQLSTFKSMQDYLANMDTPKNQLEKLRLSLVKDVQSGKLSLKAPETLRRAQLLGLPVTAPKPLTAEDVTMLMQKLRAGELDIEKKEADLAAQRESQGAPTSTTMKGYYELVSGMSPDLPGPERLKAAAFMAKEDRDRQVQLEKLQLQGTAADVPGSEMNTLKRKLERDEDLARRATAFGDDMTKMLVTSRLKAMNSRGALSSLSSVMSSMGYMNLPDETRESIEGLVTTEVKGLSRQEAASRYDDAMDKIAMGLWNAGEKKKAAFILDLLEEPQEARMPFFSDAWDTDAKRRNQ